MKLFVSGFILLMFVSSTLGDTPPMPLQEDANPGPSLHRMRATSKVAGPIIILVAILVHVDVNNIM